MTLWQRWLRTPRTVLLRRVFFQVHLWIGLAIGLWVVALSVTGSALVFRREVDRAVPRAPRVEGRGFLTEAQLRQAALAEYPDAVVESIGQPQPRSAVVRLNLRRNGEPFERSFNGQTGEDLGDPFPWPGQMMVRLAEFHDDLLLVDGRRGRLWNGVGSIFLLGMCVTGAVLWWRGLKVWPRGLAFSPRSAWPRLNFDMHSAMGFWGFAIIALWAISGIYFAWPDPFHAIIDRIWGPAEAWDFQPRPGDRALRWMTRLHFGRWRSHTLKVVWVTIGLIPAAMLVTGAAMWWHRVIRRRPLFEDESKRIVEAGL